MRLEWALSGLCSIVFLVGCGSSSTTNFDATPVANTGAGGSTVGGSGGTTSAGGAGGATSGGTSNAGSGGTTASGGNGGSAGTSSGGSTAGGSGGGDTGGFASTEEPIDDMEDGDGQIIEQGGRDGYWFVSDDATGWTNPAEGGLSTPAWNPTMRGQSVRSIEIMGGNHTGWGVLAGFNFMSGDTPPPYNVSPYSGISFYARSAMGSVDLTVGFPDVTTSPWGNICDPQQSCYQHSHAHVTLGGEWKKFQVLFSSLTRDGGVPGTLSLSSVYGIQFSVAGDTNFDIWIDDIAFTKP